MTAGEVLATVRGPVRDLLTAERTALNLLRRRRRRDQLARVLAHRERAVEFGAGVVAARGVAFEQGVHELRGANEVTFVLAVHVVHHDDRRAPADLTDGFLDIAEAFRTVGDL